MTAGPTESSAEQPPPYRWKFVLFFFSAILVLAVSDVLYQACGTLRQLDLVEAARDQWQRPAEILSAMNLKPGSQAIDLGSGAGYFTLKLSSIVGARGKVFAVDIRKLPLVFLWLRAFPHAPHNIVEMLAEPLDPHLRSGAADAVLVANTYHELADPHSMLARLFQSLRSNGRLVMVDRKPPSGEAGRESSHYVSPALAARGLRQAGFVIIHEDDRFTSDPDGDVWWLIVVRKP
jgi:predicted methyltransferase